MGLAVGLLMIFYLLGLIVANGFGAFWPQRVAQLELKDGSAARLRDAPLLAGEVGSRLEADVAAGTLDPPTGLTTTAAVFTDQAADYHQLDQTLVQYPKDQ